LIIFKIVSWVLFSPSFFLSFVLILTLCL
jgi:hypothetical protein